MEKDKSKLKKLEQEAAEEDNDLKFMGKANKVLREKRAMKAEDWIVELKKTHIVVYMNYKYTFKTEEHGTIDFYPKANKLLIRKKNKWIKPGLRWIIKNIIKKQNND